MPRNEIKKLELEIPEMMAMSMFLFKYSDENGKMGDILSDDEFLLEQEMDPGFKDLCDLLLEFPFDFCQLNRMHLRKQKLRAPRQA